MNNSYDENGFDGWFYKADERTTGPVSRVDLQKLLDSGHVSPCQAVWTNGKQGLVFVRTTTATADNSTERKSVWHQASETTAKNGSQLQSCAPAFVVEGPLEQMFHGTSSIWSHGARGIDDRPGDLVTT